MDTRSRARALMALVLTLALLVPALSAPAQGEPKAQASGAKKSCGTLAFRGKHNLVARHIGCGKAKHFARYVIKRRKTPQGWSCSLGKIDKRTASCARGKKAFAFSPA